MALRLALDARKLNDFGIGTYIRALLRGLEARPDLELTVLARTGHEERVAGLAPGARVVATSARGYSVAEHVQVPAILWREQVDLVHFPHYVAPHLFPRPMVVTIHDLIQLFYPPKGRAQLARIYLRLMIGSSLRRAKRVITVSRSSRRDLINLFSADPQRLMVVANGVDPGIAKRPAKEDLDQLRAHYGLRSPLILVVANDKPHKNLDMVLRAYHLAVREHRIPGQLVFLGGANEECRLAVRAERLGLGDRVRFLGRVPQAHLYALYHVSAVLMHISLYEGFGLPVLEAMCAGLPVITSNLGAMRELGDGAAKLVNPLEVDEVAEAIERVLVDDPLRRRMIESGRKRAENLSWERMVEETVAVYRTALGEG
ncbi:MAG: glycosyltransferase family 4 protein [Acidobacteria bacterium]|jgi:glycosyltransferase involved in cell wall biosynthesis|nr:glycosyltransferase family 4 protein [Acidobacteriota bacterium]